MQNRRVFLTGAAATLALPLAGSGLIHAQAQARRGGAAPPNDVMEEVLRQTLDSVRVVTRPGRLLTGEMARRLASSARIFGAELAARGADGRIRQMLRRAVNAEGRAAFLAKRPDLESYADTLRAHGVDIDASRFAGVADDVGKRGEALDFLMNNGLQAAWQRVAAAFDRLGAQLDKSGGGRLIQWGPWSGPDCGAYHWELFMLELLMFAMCWPFVEVPFACAVAAAGYYAYAAFVMSMGC